MRAAPDDLDLEELRAALATGWGSRTVELNYRPVGFGSHHWLAVDDGGTHRFVSVDDLEAGFQPGPDADGSFDALERAFGAAALLREEAGLEFVVAPLRDRDGAVIRRLAPRYAVRVMPFVDARSQLFGEYETANERRRMGTVLGRLHGATDAVPGGLPRRDDFAVPSRKVLDATLADLDVPWTTGPFAEPARELLQGRAEQLERRLLEHDELASVVAERSDDWVVTHGETHRANVMLDRDGGLHLVDWDTLLVAPRERDLRPVLDRDLTGWDEYRAVAGDVGLHDDTIELYRRWWVPRRHRNLRRRVPAAARADGELRRRLGRARAGPLR